MAFGDQRVKPWIPEFGYVLYQNLVGTQEIDTFNWTRLFCCQDLVPMNYPHIEVLHYITICFLLFGCKVYCRNFVHLKLSVRILPHFTVSVTCSWLFVGCVFVVIFKLLNFSEDSVPEFEYIGISSKFTWIFLTVTLKYIYYIYIYYIYICVCVFNMYIACLFFSLLWSKVSFS